MIYKSEPSLPGGVLVVLGWVTHLSIRINSLDFFLNDYSYSLVHTRIVTNGYAEIFDGTAFVVVDTSVEQKKNKEINKLKGSSTIGVITHKTEANMILLAFK